MMTVTDTRPSCELSSDEVIAYLFQAVRVREVRTVEGVRAVYEELFPDMPKDRWLQDAGHLARCLC